MTFDISNNPAEQRYEIRRSGELLGIAEYTLAGDTIRFTHTETDPQHKGQGVASALISHALDEAANRGLSVLPECPFVRDVIARNSTHYLHLVPANRRARFELPESVS